MTAQVVTTDDLAVAIDSLRRGGIVPKVALTVPEVCQAVGVGKTTAYGWVRDGLLPRVPHTERVLIPTAALEAFVLGRRIDGTRPLPAGAVDGPAESSGAAHLSGHGTRTPRTDRGARPGPNVDRAGDGTPGAA